MQRFPRWLMQGPKQACLGVFLLMALPIFSWIGSAATALVILSRGLRQANWVIATALLSALAWGLLGDLTSLILLCCIMILAITLARTSSWSVVLSIAVPVSLVAAWASITYMPMLKEQMVSVLQLKLGTQVDVSVTSLTAMIGFPVFIQQILILMLARWWQASLYKRGGLRHELHGLRLSRPIALLFGISTLLAFEVHALFVMVVVAPLLVAGICLVHHVMYQRKMGWGWLVLFYLLCFFLSYSMISYLIIATLGLLDSFFDLRKRWFARI